MAEGKKNKLLCLKYSVLLKQMLSCSRNVENKFLNCFIISFIYFLLVFTQGLQLVNLVGIQMTLFYTHSAFQR